MNQEAHRNAFRTEKPEGKSGENQGFSRKPQKRRGKFQQFSKTAAYSFEDMERSKTSSCCVADPGSCQYPPVFEGIIMNNLNSVLLEGNLTRDPEPFVFTEGNGTCMTRFSIGVNRYYLNRNKEFVQEASFFTIITWGKTAENCAKYLKKGRGVRVLGRLRQERWSVKEGETRERIVIVAEHVEFQAEKKDKPTEKLYEPRPVPPMDIDPSIEIPNPRELAREFAEEVDSAQEEAAVEMDKENPEAPF